MQLKALALSFLAASPAVAQNENLFTAKCNPTPQIRATAPKGPANNMISQIPNGSWDVGEGLGFSKNLDGGIVSASIYKNCEGQCSVTAEGQGIRAMVQFGWDECVASGRNDAGNGRFYHYIVESPITRVKYGGGTSPGTFGVPGRTIP